MWAELGSEYYAMLCMSTATEEVVVKVVGFHATGVVVARLEAAEAVAAVEVAAVVAITVLLLLSTDAGSNHMCRCHSRSTQRLHSQIILDKPHHHSTSNMRRRAHSPPYPGNVHRQTTDASHAFRH